MSSRVEMTATMLNVHLCGPLYFCVPLHLRGPFYLYVTLSLLCGSFTPVFGLSLPYGGLFPFMRLLPPWSGTSGWSVPAEGQVCDVIR